MHRIRHSLINPKSAIHVDFARSSNFQILSAESSNSCSKTQRIQLKGTRSEANENILI